MIWGIVYAGLLALLFIRVRPPGSSPPRPLVPTFDEPLALVRWHHRLFYSLLFLTPLEVWLMGSRAGGRLAGALAFGAGILLYRVGGSHLGDSLSPLVFPRPEGRMAATGLYGWVRHPMYLGQILIAFGAPLTLGVRWVRWLAVPAVVVLAVRMGREEDALRARYPEYAAYAASTWRLLPFVY